MLSPDTITAVSRSIRNKLDLAGIGGKSLAGVIGDSPSHYSKSPRLWNAAFEHLRIDAVYLPFDVEKDGLGTLLDALKHCNGFLGANVTVPHKLAVMNFLDAIDSGAERIQAVNTIVRAPDDRLIGYNTDGEGFVDSILRRQSDGAVPFIPSLAGMNVLLIGAGGSARAGAFHLADEISDGKLVICNRTIEHALDLARDLQKAGTDAVAISEEELPSWATKAGLIVNATTKGQGGMRRLSDGTATWLEPYSALAPAQPPAFTEAQLAMLNAEERWQQAALPDIDSNHAASLKLVEAIPKQTRFYDLIYHPEETVFLRHARSTGHATMNGKAMIINQAVRAFCGRICKAELQARSIDRPGTYDEILSTMYSAW